MSNLLSVLLVLFGLSANAQEGTAPVTGGRLTCPSGECNPALAALAIRHGDGQISHCTGFLIDETHIMTNRHCLVDDLAVEGADCSGRIDVEFVSLQTHAPETATCGRVVQVGQAPSTGTFAYNIDYAVLELSGPVSRPPVRISDEGIDVNQTYRTEVIDFEESWQVRINAPCTPVAESMMSAGAHRFVPVQALRNCVSIRGNSGSPLFNSAGDVVGIVTNVLNLEEQARERVRSHALTPERFEPTISAVNLACVPWPSSRSVPTECSDRNSWNRPTSTASDEDLRRYWASIGEDWGVANADWERAFRWMLRPLRDLRQISSYVTVLLPQCINAPSQIRGLELDRRVEQFRAPISLPYREYLASYGPHLEFFMVPSPGAPTHLAALVTLRPREILNPRIRSSRVRIDVWLPHLDGGRMIQQTLLDTELPRCTPERRSARSR